MDELSQLNTFTRLYPQQHTPIHPPTHPLVLVVEDVVLPSSTHPPTHSLSTHLGDTELGQLLLEFLKLLDQVRLLLGAEVLCLDFACWVGWVGGWVGWVGWWVGWVGGLEGG